MAKEVNRVGQQPAIHKPGRAEKSSKPLMNTKEKVVEVAQPKVKAPIPIVEKKPPTTAQRTTKKADKLFKGIIR